MGLHTGTPTVAAEGYVGIDVHRAARVAALAHGGQVIVSAATAALLEDGRSGISDRTDSRTSTLQPGCSSSASPTSRLYERRVLLTFLLRRLTSSGASASSLRRLPSGSTATRAC
jgi:class 3 adenylate cyclase